MAIECAAVTQHDMVFIITTAKHLLENASCRNDEL